MRDDDERWLDDDLMRGVAERAIADIDESTHERSDALMCDLMCAAWGSEIAQNQ